MFLQFYGLKEQPFGVTPDPHFIYPSRTYRKAFYSLCSGIEAGCGFLALIAKPGMGKTTLIFQLLKQLEQKCCAVFLFQTQCDSRELLRYLLSGLGLSTAGLDIVTMHEKLNQLLARELLAGRRFVLIIDECQNLDNSVLETVRLLSDFETPKAKLMQIILAGQTELADKLASPSLQQLRQRISIVSRMEPLTPAETGCYIEHRLQLAGYVGAPLFTAGAFERIFARSEGVPRNINNLCFNALLIGRRIGRKQIDSDIVDQVLTDLDMDARPELPPPPPRSSFSFGGIPRGDVSDRKQVDLGRGNLLARAPTENPKLPQRLSTTSTVPRFSYGEIGGSERRFWGEALVFDVRTLLTCEKDDGGEPVGSNLLQCVHQTSNPADQVPKVATDFDADLPLRKPGVTPLLAPATPPQKAQSDLSTTVADFSVEKPVASTRVDSILVAQNTSQAEGIVSPAPQLAPVRPHPAAPKGSSRRIVEGALALGAAVAFMGLLPFYSKVGGSRQQQAPPARATAHVVTPLPAPQDSQGRQRQPHSPSATTAPPVPVFLTRTLGLKIGRIAIDPGHGGDDTGTTGPTGLMEKDLCLDVALRLGRIIEKRLPGTEVIFTRADDTFIPLKERTQIANNNKADLFLSIHANSSPNQAARGVETYYLNLRGSPEAMEVALRENATAQETVSDLQELVKKIARSEKTEESREFAKDIQDSLTWRIQRTVNGVKNRGVRRAPFVVLIGADMPSVLAEISFLSNPSDEQLLKNDEYCERLAEGLYQGVLSYLQSLNSVAYDRPARKVAATPDGN